MVRSGTLPEGGGGTGLQASIEGGAKPSMARNTPLCLRAGPSVVLDVQMMISRAARNC